MDSQSRKAPKTCLHQDRTQKTSTWGSGGVRGASGGSGRSLAWREPWTVSRQRQRHPRRAQISGSLGQHRHTHTHTQAPPVHLHQTGGERQSWATLLATHTHTLAHANPLQRLSKMGREVCCVGRASMSQCNLRHLEKALSCVP